MVIPPYDNKEYRFRDDDASAQAGRKRVVTLLGLSKIPSQDELQFDLSFFSGGIGVYDKLAITMNADADMWSQAKKQLSANTPTESTRDDEWSEDFNWLIYGNDESCALDNAVASFINRERKDFQDECSLRSIVLFQRCSNVNDWATLWGTENRLNYLAFSQG